MNNFIHVQMFNSIYCFTLLCSSQYLSIIIRKICNINTFYLLKISFEIPTNQFVSINSKYKRKLCY